MQNVAGVLHTAVWLRQRVLVVESLVELETVPFFETAAEEVGDKA